jgi:chromosome segregation protein
MIEISQKKSSPAKKNSETIYFDANEIRTFASELEEFIEQAEGEENLVIMQNVLASIKRLVHNFLLAKISKADSGNQVEMSGSDVEELLAEKDAIIGQIDGLNADESKLTDSLTGLRKAIAAEEMKLREADRAEIELSMEKKELAANINLINLRVENLAKAESDFEAEIKEGSVLIGAQVLEYKNFNIEGEINRAKQEELKRKIERIKIRLEDIGVGGGGDVMKEYEEVTQRDQFLAKELEDLNKSIESLEQLSKELKEKLDVKFREGIEKINDQFEEFFKLMFGGGAASLKVAALEKKVKILDGDDEEAEAVEDDEDEEVQYGIEINVSLPHKKVKELHALSGGERSLTSIALLFAMSQVNPPPFLILDETDAALDEANSRKYGDMLELLAKFSQLVVVTHNRETMSRASTLYGVTIGSDGGSKLLSIKFDEAVAIAK